MPDFIIEKPYLLLKTLNYLGNNTFAIAQNAEVFTLR